MAVAHAAWACRVNGKVRATMALLLRADDCSRSASRDRRLFLVCRAAGAELRQRHGIKLVARIASCSWRQRLAADAADFAAGIPSVDGGVNFTLWHRNAPWVRVRV